jgi:WD40 repeat protein
LGRWLAGAGALLVLAGILLILLVSTRSNDAPGPQAQNAPVSGPSHADASAPGGPDDEPSKRLLAPDSSPAEPPLEKSKPAEDTPQPPAKPPLEKSKPADSAPSPPATPPVVVKVERTPQRPRRLKRFVIWKGEPRNTPTHPGIYVTGTAFSPDGRTLAATYGRKPYTSAFPGRDKPPPAFTDHHIALWDVEKETEARRLKPATPLDLPYGPAFAPDGKRLLTLSGRTMSVNLFDGVDASLRVWDTASGAELACRQCTGLFASGKTKIKARLSCAAFTLDGHRIVTSSDFHGLPAAPMLVPGMIPGAGGNELVNPDRFALGLWNENLGGEPRSLTGHTAPAVALAFSPDGKHVFSASGYPRMAGHLIRSTAAGRAKLGSWDKGSVRQWDLAVGREVRQFPGHNRGVCLAVSPDGKRLLTADDDAEVRCWDLTTGALVYQFTASSQPTRFAFSPDGHRVLIGALERILLHDVETGRELLRLRACQKHGDFPALTDVAFSVDGQRALIVILDDQEHEVAVEEWALGDLAPGQPAEQPDVARSPNPPLDKTPTVPALPMPEKPQTVPPSPSSVSPKQEAPKDLRRLRRMIIWKYDNDIPQADQPYLSGTAFSSDDQTLAATYGVMARGSVGPEKLRQAAAPNRITLWSLKTGKELRRVKLASPINHPHAPAFSPDGARLVAVSGANLGNNLANGFEASVRLWDTATGAELAAQVSGSFERPDVLGRDYPMHPVCLSRGVVSPNGRYILTASDDRDLAYGPGWQTRVYRSPGLPVARADFSVRVWDAKLKRELRRLTGHIAPVHALAFSPDGKHVFSASGWLGRGPLKGAQADDSLKDDCVRQWSLATGREVRRFVSPGGSITCLAVSPDGSRLLTGGHDMRVRCWDVKTAHVLHDFGGRRLYASNLTFSSDGRWALLAGNECPKDRTTPDDSIRLCDVESGAELLLVRKCDYYPTGSIITVSNAAFSAEGRRVIVVANEHRVQEVVVEEWELPQSVLDGKRK